MITDEFKKKMSIVLECDLSNLNQAIDLDSLTRVEIVVLAEEMLGVNLTDKDVKAQSTIGDLFRTIEGKMK